MGAPSRLMLLTTIVKSLYTSHQRADTCRPAMESVEPRQSSDRQDLFHLWAINAETFYPAACSTQEEEKRVRELSNPIFYTAPWSFRQHPPRSAAHGEVLLRLDLPHSTLRGHTGYADNLWSPVPGKEDSANITGVS